MKKITQVFVFLSMVLLLSSCAGMKNFSLLFDRENAKPEFRTLWAKNLDPIYDTGNLPIALQSPAISDGLVFVGDNNGYFHAFELENGKEVWKVNDRSNYHSKPVVYKDQVIYGTQDGRVFSRATVTGELKYNVDLGASVEGSGVISNGKIFFHLRNHQVFALDIETGKILWAYKRSVPYLTTLQRAAKPVVLNNRLYVGFADGTLAALNLDEGLLAFEVKLSTGIKFVDLDNPISVIDGKIYAGVMGGPLHIINAENGAIIKRSEIIASRNPTIEGEELLVPMPNGTIVRADKNLNVISEKKIAKGAVSDFKVFGDSYLATSTNGEVVELEKRTLKVKRAKHLGHTYSAVFGEVDINQKHIALMSSRNRLYIFQ